MKHHSMFNKFIFYFTMLMLFINVYLIYELNIDRKVIRIINNKLENEYSRKNELKLYIKQNFELFKLSIDDVVKSFPELNNSLNKNNCYVVFVPSGACKACISTFFSEIKDNNKICSKNFYMISELDDLVLERLWISNGYDKNKFTVDKFSIFKRSGMVEKIVLSKIDGSINHYDFIQYDLFLGELLDDFINVTT